ncbi:MAG: NUDIX domain-containing protein [Clostridiales bacterium]|nr:NUDIX domain-containing protein [Clostridiales bacterium]
MNIDNKNFMLTVNLAIFKVAETARTNVKKLPQKELTVLLTRRKREPYKGCWSFPYRFVGVDESLDDAVFRELEEKTDSQDVYFEQLYTWGATDRDPTARVIAASYIAIVREEHLKPRFTEENQEFQWFGVRKRLLSAEKLSDLNMRCKYRVTLCGRGGAPNILYDVFEETSAAGFEKRTKYGYEPCAETGELMAYDHIKILDCALDRIKNKVQYTNIAFGLLPELFTLSELQQAHEVLLGRELTKPNFRRWISAKVEETPHTKKDGAHRPARLYRLKKSSMLDGLLTE